MRALIFSGGKDFSLPDNFNIKEYNIIIGADRGYLYAESIGVVPDVYVGDFDSLPENIQVKSREVVKLNPEKDMTDTQAAIDKAISLGAKEITVLGALGGRIDHMLGNIHLLKYGLDKNVKIEIADSKTYVTLIKDETQICKKQGFCLSLIPFTRCENVTVSGVYYPLNNASLDLGTTLGVSNEIICDSAKISVGDGFLLVMLCSVK